MSNSESAQRQALENGIGNSIEALTGKVGVAFLWKGRQKTVRTDGNVVSQDENIDVAYSLHKYPESFDKEKEAETQNNGAQIRVGGDRTESFRSFVAAVETKEHEKTSAARIRSSIVTSRRDVSTLLSIVAESQSVAQTAYRDHGQVTEPAGTRKSL